MADADLVATATLTIPNVKGTYKEVWGTFKAGTRATAYTGAVNTGLKEVFFMTLERQKNSTASSDTQDSWIVTTLPAAGESVSIVAGTSQSGYWHAVGR